MSAIAREAGALLMQYFHQGLKIEYKGDADLVTAADRASETLIRERISQQFPSHDVLGEEQGLNDQGSDYRWYVDPLDGTTNFAHGYPVFCVSMALEHRALEHPVRAEAARDRRSGLRSDARRIVHRRAGKRRAPERQADPRVQGLAVEGMPGGDGLSQPQAAQESEHSLLPPDHAAHSRSAARGIGRARFVQRGQRALRRLLGIQSQSVGHGRGRAHRGRSRAARSAASTDLRSGSTAARRWRRMGWCTTRCCTNFRRSSRDEG